MDFYKEVETRREGELGKMGELSYRRFQLSKEMESCQKQIAEIDTQLAQAEIVVGALTQVQRDFTTYLAVKEGALTLQQLGNAIEDKGGAGEASPPSD